MLLFIKPFCGPEDNPHEMCVEHCGCKYGDTIMTRREFHEAGWVKIEEAYSEDVEPYLRESRCPECAEDIQAEMVEIVKLHRQFEDSDGTIIIEDHRQSPFFESFYPQPEIIEL